MEKQKRKNRKPRKPFDLACSGLIIAFMILCVPTFCVWSYNLLNMGLSTLYIGNAAMEFASLLIFIMPLIGIIAAIGTSYYTVYIMKLYRLDGVASLTTLAAIAAELATYFLATGLDKFFAY